MDKANTYKMKGKSKTFFKGIIFLFLMFFMVDTFVLPYANFDNEMAILMEMNGADENENDEEKSEKEKELEREYLTQDVLNLGILASVEFLIKGHFITLPIGHFWDIPTPPPEQA